jgi:hypothetical protein
MSLLTLEELKAWSDLLPPDFAAEIGEPDSGSAAHLAAISAALPALKDSASVVSFAADNQDAFIGIGRAGRIRFLAALSGSLGRADSAAAIARLAEGGDGDEGKGTTKVAPYFKSDLEALAAALGRRMARGMVDTYTLDVIAGASYEAVAAMDMRGGGL